MADREALCKIIESYMAVQKMFQDGQIDEPTLHKMSVAIAYEMAVAGEMGEAVSMLHAIPLSYFQETQGRQMEADAQYRDVAFAMAQMLVDAGIVTLGSKVVPNMLPAKA